MAKFHKCRFCGGENIKQSTMTHMDGGYMAYTTCQDCYFSVRTTHEQSYTLGLYSSRNEAKRVCKELWNLINEACNILSEDRNYCDFPSKYDVEEAQEKRNKEG